MSKAPTSPSTSSSLKEKLAKKDNWITLIFIILFAFINYFVQILSWGIAIFQWLSTLITNKPNERICEFGKQLSTYSYQILNFLTYNSNLRPFPFSDWPKREIENISNM